MYDEEQIKNLYSDTPRPQILQRAHNKFHIPTNCWLNYELVTVYILSVLKKNDSYALELEQELTNRTTFRVSSTLLNKVLDDLSTEKVVTTYLQKNEGRGRSKIMYKLTKDWYIHAIVLVIYWEEFIKSSKLFQLIETLNTSSPSNSAESELLDNLAISSD